MYFYVLILYFTCKSNLQETIIIIDLLFMEYRMETVKNRSEIYKFKIADTRISVIIDDYYIINHQKQDIKTALLQNNMHYHAVYEMFFVSSSPLLLLTDNESLEYKNCVVCIPPFFRHRSYGNNIHKVFFSVDGLEKATSDFSQFISDYFTAQKPFEFAISEPIEFCINEIELLLKNKNSINNEVIESLLKLIFYYVYLENFKNENKETFSGNESYLIKIDSIINHYQNDINLKTVADELCLSTKQASRIIKKNFKKPLSDLVTEKRLYVACDLLKNSQKSISEIVEHINFSSETYFYYQFKKNYGCTPSEYRNKKIAD